MFKMILSKAKNMLFENNGTSSSSNIFSFATKVGSIITGIGKWPLVFGGFIFAFLLTILIIVFAYPEDAAGELFNKTGTSDTCNEDPSSVEYAYEPLQGGLAIPHFHQIDERWSNYPMKNWDYDPPKDDTLGANGCAFTSAAMVVSYLKGRNIYPTEVVDKLEGYEIYIDEWSHLTSAFNIQTPTYYIRDGSKCCSDADWNAHIQEMKDAIRDGHPIIAHYGRGGHIFTSLGHFVVIRGMTSDGKFLVNDPSDNSTINSLHGKGKYINRHFTEDEITDKLDWIVIFEKKNCSSSSINAGSDARNKIIEAAKSQLGVPYVWGGESPGIGLDCSGLTQYAYSQAGIAIPHQSQLQKDTCLETGGKIVGLDEAKPGDIVWWPGIAGAEYGGSGHVAIYIGNNQIIEAPNLNGNVKVSELGSNNWLSSYGGILQWPI
ncbi:MAG: NlpC/P60 family protein [Bacilli bacterium]|nr:NlpC/P60 family protein [Bacilli bacterium]